jgi:S-adenosylmethionine-dependent methyltransferase
VTAFEPAERNWVDRLGNLRNVIRQEVIARQLAPEAYPGMTVLDVGCGQGTQALRLAALGCSVTGIEPSSALLQLCADQALDRGLQVELIQSRMEELDEVLGGRQFDLVTCHGVFMYLGDRSAGIQSLARHRFDAGKLSITFRNGHALAMRPALRRDWTGALEAFDSLKYVNELGLRAVADRIEDVESDLRDAGLGLITWYGVRVFNDAIPADTAVPDGDELADLLDLEEEAGRTDPYRLMGSQLHVIAGSPPS